MITVKGQVLGESGSELEQGIGIYRKFNRFPPSRVESVSHNRVMPGVVVELGELVGLIYRSDKDNPGEPRNYIHFMETLPRLVSDVQGRQLYLVGGNYQVTERGIEG